jgi:DNA-binding MarR family transcriptional regulator
MQTNDTLEASVFKAFIYFDGLVRHSIADCSAGLSKTQMMAMVILDTGGALNVGKIAEWLAVSREQASRAVSGLEEKGLVKKERNADNWRNVDIALTEEGVRLSAEMRASALGFIREALGALDDDEAERLRFCSQQAALLLSRVGESASRRSDSPVAS